MSLQEKFALLKGKKQELLAKSTSQSLGELPTKSMLSTREDLYAMQNSLSMLKTKKTYSTTFSLNTLAKKIRLIILLDNSSSMYGTERDIYEGIMELCIKHREDNIVLTFVVFNDEKKVIYKDKPISFVMPQIIETMGKTNLNGTLYEVIKNYSDYDDIHNLLVTISDGKDNIQKVSSEDVANLMKRVSQELNNFYFLGEADDFTPEEEVFEQALDLGFKRNNIEVFTRKASGNKLNFEVISTMIDDLLKQGKIRPDWNAPIKEHYLALTDKRRR